MINRTYSELTQEQQAFREANPTASVAEVWNMQLVQPWVPQAQDVADYAARRASELKSDCGNAVTVSSLEFAMAIDKVNNITADSWYSLSDARNVLAEFRRQSKAAMQVYSDYAPQISEASTMEAVDTLYDSAITELGGIIDGE